MQIHKTCPLCGSEKISELFKCTDFYISGESFPVDECLSCHFIFTNKYPREESIARYYQSDDYISHSDTGAGLTNKIYHIVRKRMLSGKFKLLRQKSGLSSAELIDIGSGTGLFPLYLKQKGWKCEGLELSKDARDFAFQKNNIKLHHPEFIDEVNPNSIDIITMWHTLEHFHKPDKYLESAYRILKSKGLLVIAVPNHNSYDAKRYKQFWAAWDVPRHLWHFNPASIRKYLMKYDFKFESAHRLSFDSFYVSVLSEKYKKSSLSVIKGFFTGFVSWFVSLINKEKTSSLIYVFRKD